MIKLPIRFVVHTYNGFQNMTFYHGDVVVFHLSLPETSHDLYFGLQWQINYYYAFSLAIAKDLTMYTGTRKYLDKKRQKIKTSV